MDIFIHFTHKRNVPLIEKSRYLGIFVNGDSNKVIGGMYGEGVVDDTFIFAYHYNTMRKSKKWDCIPKQILNNPTDHKAIVFMNDPKYWDINEYEAFTKLLRHVDANPIIERYWDIVFPEASCAAYKPYLHKDNYFIVDAEEAIALLS